LLGIHVNIKGGLKFAWKVKIRVFDTFSRCKSREVGYCVSHRSKLKLSSRRRLYGVCIYYVKGYRARH